MSTTDTRAAFEEWAKKNFNATNFERGNSGGYINSKMHIRWESWQAATEAAKATGTAGNLPPLPESQADGDSTCDFHGRLFSYTAEDMCEYGQQCAEAAAVKYKEIIADKIHTISLYRDAVKDANRRAEYAEAARQPAPAVMPPAVAVSRDADSPGMTGVLVTFARPLSDGQLRELHEYLNRSQP